MPLLMRYDFLKSEIWQCRLPLGMCEGDQSGTCATTGPPLGHVDPVAGQAVRTTRSPLCGYSVEPAIMTADDSRKEESVI